jgi:prevent-host-death family protein
MDYIQFTEFRNNSKEYFERIEKGESYIIIRKGKPVAQILPLTPGRPGWKRKTTRIGLSNRKKSTTDFLREERSEE